jgi:hypothetical protein
MTTRPRLVVSVTDRQALRVFLVLLLKLLRCRRQWAGFSPCFFM